MPMMPPDMDLQKHFANRRSLSEARAAHLVSILNREQTSQNTDIRYGRRGTKIMRSYHDADSYGEPQRSSEGSAMRLLWRDPRMSVDGDHGLAFRAGTKLFHSIQTLPSYVPMFKRCKAVLRTPLDAITSGARASFGCSHAQTNR